MKRPILFLLLSAGALAALPLYAQPADDAGSQTVSGGDTLRGTRPPPPHVQRYFEILKEKDPAEYERLTALRETDPDAFRTALMERLRKRWEQREWDSDRKGGEHPWRKRDARGPQTAGIFFRPEHGYSDGAQPTPELETLEIKIADLARSVRDAATDSEKAQLQQELTAEIGNAFDLRQRMRQERLAQMEKRVEHIKTILQDRQSKRDSIIQNRLNELLNAPSHPDSAE